MQAINAINKGPKAFFLRKNQDIYKRNDRKANTTIKTSHMIDSTDSDYEKTKTKTSSFHNKESIMAKSPKIKNYQKNLKIKKFAEMIYSLGSPTSKSKKSEYLRQTDKENIKTFNIYPFPGKFKVLSNLDYLSKMPEFSPEVIKKNDFYSIYCNEFLYFILKTLIENYENEKAKRLIEFNIKNFSILIAAFIEPQNCLIFKYLIQVKHSFKINKYFLIIKIKRIIFSK